MAYFVTGATGFIGRHLVEELLRNRSGDVHVLVRATSRDRLDELIASWPDGDRVKPVTGDLALPMLGVDEAWIAEHRGAIDHFFHLAAIYDMTADEERNERLNVDGTRNAVALANALESGTLHHTSSIAAAGEHRGLFREDMFDEGQKLPSAYHRTKFESEKIAREDAAVPWRVYRPAVVVGHSQTGVMDKIDGPYYFFKAIQKIRGWLPEWAPLIGPELGHTNVVPVDYVARAMDHIAHQEGLDGQAFHLAHPKGQRSGDVLNAFARAGHAPHMAMRIDKRLLDALPKGALSMVMKLPALRGVRDAILADFGIPPEVIGHVGFTSQFDTRDTERALAGSGIEVPELETYAARLWDHWERVLDPDLYKDRSFEHAVNGRTVVITGASSGIGKEAAMKIARAGGIPILVARSMDKLEEAKAEIEQAGGTAYAYSADLSSLDSIEELVDRLLADHAAIDMLINNAGRSIRRSIALSQDRFHDFERTVQLNYLGTIKLTMGLLPHMRERRFGHIVNVSSIGVQTSPPRFSAYVASKAALDAWTRVASSELIGDSITFTTIHMPLVRTPMIAPTKIYDSFPTISPSEAGDLICEAIRAKPKQINTRLGTFGEVLYAVAPKAVDQILHMAYKVFPDSAAARGEKDPGEKASVEQIAMANIMRGVHW
ncbi:SDR family oxidoreductase [Baekduia soli]|uniref:SDR family oxidoreductase n=1 Tax=Baekduia soli TaxID=496014 RepID=A0A5B8U4B3_9ACTN|nr:SDR family oxidoreductase [Baekduia soli]QEC47807.1 SDR family oxidoreductase [Baekduia soli]